MRRFAKGAGQVRRLDLPRDDIVQKYEGGTRPRDIAAECGCNYRTILNRLHEWGVDVRVGAVPGNTNSRPPGGPRPRWGSADQYLATVDRRGGRTLLHRGCWEACHGPIPEGHVVHHINSDPEDNQVENLACMGRGAHTTLHKTRKTP